MTDHREVTIVCDPLVPERGERVTRNNIEFPGRLAKKSPFTTVVYTRVGSDARRVCPVSPPCPTLYEELRMEVSKSKD